MFTMLWTVSCFLFQAKVEIILMRVVSFSERIGLLLSVKTVPVRAAGYFSASHISIHYNTWNTLHTNTLVVVYRLCKAEIRVRQRRQSRPNKYWKYVAFAVKNFWFRAVWEQSIRWISPLETTVARAEAGSHGKHPFSPPPTSSSSSSCRSCTETLLCRTKTRPTAPTMKSDESKKKTHKRRAEISLLQKSVPAGLVVCRLAFSN